MNLRNPTPPAAITRRPAAMFHRVYAIRDKIDTMSDSPRGRPVDGPGWPPVTCSRDAQWLPAPARAGHSHWRAIDTLPRTGRMSLSDAWGKHKHGGNRVHGANIKIAAQIATNSGSATLRGRMSSSLHHAFTGRAARLFSQGLSAPEFWTHAWFSRAAAVAGLFEVLALAAGLYGTAGLLPGRLCRLGGGHRHSRCPRWLACPARKSRPGRPRGSGPAGTLPPRPWSWPQAPGPLTGSSWPRWPAASWP